MFLSDTTPYLEMFFNIYKKFMAPTGIHEYDAGDACRILESVLHNCRGTTNHRVDALLPEILDLTVNRLKTCKTTSLKILLLEAIANSIYYNAPLVLHILQARDMVPTVFTIWFQTIPKFKRFYDKKLIILGLGAVFNVRTGSLPPAIQQGSAQILATLLQLLSATEEYRKDMELAKLDEEDKEEDEEDEEDDEDEEEIVEFQHVADNEDIDAIDSDDEGEFQMLTSALNKRLKGDSSSFFDDADDEAEEVIVEGDEDGESGEEEDEEGDEDEDEAENEEYSTPIDEIDELVFFASKLKEIHDNEPQVYQALVGTLSPKQQQDIQEFVKTAHVRAAAPKEKPQ